MDKSIIAKTYYSGFPLAHDTYNAISTASDGKVYYVLSSESHEQGGQLHVYDPATDETMFLADLTEISGEKDARSIAQGKSHVEFFEYQGKLYFSTHVGYYETIAGMERLPVNAPGDYGLYPGGHILSYDLSDGSFEDLALAPEGEGVLAMTMDTERGGIYAITWPRGYFISYECASGQLQNHGLISENGEAGEPGADYRVLCRSLLTDPGTGNVYFSTSEGDIFCYKPAGGKLEKLPDLNLRLDYFGSYDPTRPGSMGYNWRKICWYPAGKAAYGVHGNSGYLFRFDPSKADLSLVERITSEPSRKSGMYDQFSYGYLGFQLGPDQETLYYLTGAPIYENGKRLQGADEIARGAARGLENLHLVTFHIPSGKYSDHGPVFYHGGGRPTYVNSIAIGRDGHVYTLARFEHEGKMIQDLVKIPDPLAE